MNSIQNYWSPDGATISSNQSTEVPHRGSTIDITQQSPKSPDLHCDLWPEPSKLGVMTQEQGTRQEVTRPGEEGRALSSPRESRLQRSLGGQGKWKQLSRGGGICTGFFKLTDIKWNRERSRNPVTYAHYPGAQFFGNLEVYFGLIYGIWANSLG